MRNVAIIWVSGSMGRHDGLETDGIKVEKRKLKTIMDECGRARIDPLKMDIEGSKFEVIENILNENIEVAQLCMEAHDKFFENGDAKLKSMLSRLKETGYVLASFSDILQEFAFIKC